MWKKVLVALLLGVVTTSGTAEGAHTMDTNSDYQVSLSELLRLIQFNSLGGIHCDAESEDGYAPGFDPESLECPAHSSDYNPADGQVDLNELLRGVQLYNAGNYMPAEDTEDGFQATPKNNLTLAPAESTALMLNGQGLVGGMSTGVDIATNGDGSVAAVAVGYVNSVLLYGMSGTPTQLGIIGPYFLLGGGNIMVNPQAVAISGNSLYVAFRNNGDIPGVSNDSVRGTSGGLAVFNIASPTNPTLVGYYTSTTLKGACDLEVVGTRAYVTANEPGFVVMLNIATTNPAPLASVSLTGANKLDVESGKVFVSSYANASISEYDANTLTMTGSPIIVNNRPTGVVAFASKVLATTEGVGDPVTTVIGGSGNLSQLAPGDKNAVVAVSRGNLAYISSYDRIVEVDISTLTINPNSYSGQAAAMTVAPNGALYIVGEGYLRILR